MSASDQPGWEEVACIASGPSLTPQDCETVRRWREAAPGRAVIVVNTTFRLAPWADVLYAMDAAWWNAHIDEVRRTFRGRLINPWREMRGVERVRFEHRRNSGAGAISLAAHWGARRIVLLGYDCQRTGGQAHWHGDHPKGLGNAGTIDRWPAIFARLAKSMAGRVTVINATRETALTCFERRALSEALGDVHAQDAA